MNNKKYIGYLFFFIGIALIIYGQSVYLDGPKEIGTSTLDCTYNTITSREDQEGYFFICESPIQYEIYTHVQFVPGLILDREIKVIITNKNKTINSAYLIGFSRPDELPNSSNYSQWFESKHSLPNTEIIELRDNTSFSFKPGNNKSYAIFLLPNIWNKTLDPSIIVTEHFAYKKIDFSRAWNGFFIALFGSAMVLLGFFFWNPIDKIIIKISSITKPLYSSNYKEYKEHFWKHNPFIWKWLLGLQTLIVILLFIKYPLNDKWDELPQEIKFIIQDYFIRLAIFTFFFCLLFTFSIILIYEIASSILEDLINLFMERRGFAINVKLKENTLKILYKELISPSSIFMYILTGASLLYVSYYLNSMTLFTTLFIFSGAPLIFYVSYKTVLSSKRACRLVGANDIIELQNAEVITTKIIILFTWVIIAIIVFNRFTINMLINTIQNKILGTSLYALTTNPILREKALFESDEIIIFSNVFSKELIFSVIILIAFTYLSIIICTNYLITPVTMRKQEAIRYIKEISIFLLAFISMQIISEAPDFSALDIKIILTKSFVVSIMAYFFTYSYRQLISRKAEKSE